MQAEIITIGDEILIGQIVDTNSAWMAQELNMAGISVKQITSVSDDREHILKALDEAKLRADIILITGGLGPTNDDITKKTMCEYFNCKLRFDKAVYEDVKILFESRGYEVTPVNRAQAEVPENCIAIRNKNGTAPGMWFEENNKIFVSMPGVPYEMKGMMTEYVIPQLKKKFKLPAIIHKTILTQGISESFLADLIKEWESSLKEKNIKLAYLPSPSMVKLRLSVSGNDKEKLNAEVDRKIEELKKIISPYIYGYETYGEESETIEKIIGKLLTERNQTLSIAESCTGGYISHLVTKVPGCSIYFEGSFVSYSYGIKEAELNVKLETLQQFGAVSKEVVEQMAKGVRERFKTDYSVAASGIAGPSGGTPEKPVGTIWIAVASKNKIIAEKFQFGNNRERNIHRSAITALNMLRKEILNIKS